MCLGEGVCASYMVVIIPPSIFTLRLLVHSASLRSFASRALPVNSDGWRATLFFSCEIYYPLVMLWVIKCNLKYNVVPAVGGRTPPIVFRIRPPRHLLRRCLRRLAHFAVEVEGRDPRL